MWGEISGLEWRAWESRTVTLDVLGDLGSGVGFILQHPCSDLAFGNVNVSPSHLAFFFFLL